MAAESAGRRLTAAIGRASQLGPALFVLCLGLSISVVAWRFADDRVRSEANAEFEHQVAHAHGALDKRIQDEVNLLIGLRGLFAASREISRDEFRRYLSGFDMARRPGTRRVSFVRYVPQAEKRAFERSVRRDRSVTRKGYPGFTITPPGVRDDYMVITYVEPAAANGRALGFDLYSDAARRRAVEQARDGDRVIASPPTRLMTDGEEGQRSVVLVMPIYQRDKPVATVSERRAAFLGVVASTVRIDEMVAGLLKGELGREFELVMKDLGREASARPADGGLVLFESAPRPARRPAAGPGAVMSRVTNLEVGGRPWRLEFLAPAKPVHGVGSSLPQVIVLGGVLTSLLVSWLVLMQSLARERALQLARQTTAMRAAEALREQLAFIQQLIEAVPQPIFFKDAEGHYLGVNRAWEAFFGIPREQFIGKSVFELYPDNQDLAKRHHAKDQELFAQPGSQSYEAAIVAADGRVHHTIYNKATFNRPDGSVAGLIGTINDVTGLKEAEAALRQSENRFRDLTELSSDWYWEQDEEFRFTQISSKVYEFSIDAEEHIGRRRWELPLLGVTEERWEAHKRLLQAHEPFQDFVYQRYDSQGSLRTISASGRPILDEQGRFHGYRGIGRDITEQKQIEEKIRHMAHHDALTQLPNRVLLHDRIGQAIAKAQRSRQSLALLFIDLDRFKTVNDSLGHHVGDGLLKAVARRLGSCTRGSDTIARIGGDEFVVLLADLARPSDAMHVAQKVLDALSRPFEIDGHELGITPSIGICAYPHDGGDVETLMRNADTAMYHAKQMGRDNYQFFTQAMNDAAQERLALENDLRHAIERGEFVVHYQPQFDLRSGAIVGFEALVRWQHPQRGLVAPTQFIAAAEETGLIAAIGEWVLREACSQARVWHDAGHAGLQVAVNCSAPQFQRDNFVDTVRRVLEATGVPPRCLDLEITESVIIQRSEEVIARFQALDDMGVSISIDDFGTGYSSLSYLKRFAIHQLKIDQSFVRDISSDPDDAAIVSAIIAIAHSLGLKVVAEGVETSEQLAFLRSLGCDSAQGYYFSRPLPAADFGRLLGEAMSGARVVASA